LWRRPFGLTADRGGEALGDEVGLDLLSSPRELTSDRRRVAPLPKSGHVTVTARIAFVTASRSYSKTIGSLPPAPIDPLADRLPSSHV
jgi:hypothetical protein